MERATSRLMPDGRLHLAHGPIDLVVSVDPLEARAAAFGAAAARFATVLTEIVAELPALRAPQGAAAVTGSVARRMADAAAPFAASGVFITPMAAVAGAVADEILDVVVRTTRPARAIVNNGGDIALHLADGHDARARIAAASGDTLGTVVLHAGDGVGGLATSGRHGRSLSLGIADSVTALGRTAATADAAATLIANAVDLPADHPGQERVTRVAAETLDPDSDLSGQLVTTGVGPLSDHEIDAALDAGAEAAERMKGAGLLAAALFLKGEWRTVGLPHLCATVGAARGASLGAVERT